MNYRLHMGVNMSTFQKLIIFVLSIATSISCAHRRGQRYVERTLLTADLKPAEKKTVVKTSPISQTMNPSATAEKKQGSQEIIRSCLSSDDEEEEITGEASLLKAGALKAKSVLKNIAPSALVVAGSCLASNMYQAAQVASTTSGTPLSPAFLIPAATSVIASCLADGFLTENATLESVAKNVIPRILFAAPAGIAMNQLSGVKSSVKTGYDLMTDKSKRDEFKKNLADEMTKNVIKSLTRILSEPNAEINTELGTAIQNTLMGKLESEEVKTKLETLATTTLTTALQNPELQKQLIDPIKQNLGQVITSTAQAISPGFNPIKGAIKWFASKLGTGLTTTT